MLEVFFILFKFNSMLFNFFSLLYGNVMFFGLFNTIQPTGFYSKKKTYIFFDVNRVCLHTEGG